MATFDGDSDRDAGWTTKWPGVPYTATPIQRCNAAAITTTTAEAIVAGVAGQNIWVTKVHVANIHATEDTVVTLQSDAGTPVVFAHLAASGMDVSPDGGTYTFDPPFKVAAGDDLDGIGAVATTGDVFVSVTGFQGASDSA